MTNLLSQYGFTGTADSKTVARITAVHRDRFEIVTDHGFSHAKLKTKEYYVEGEIFPTVGDFVTVDWQGESDSLILSTLPRKTFFSRRDPTPGRGEQTVAANFDTIFILQSVNNDFNLNRLERYLTLAYQSGGVPVILLTKTDLTFDCYTMLSRIKRVTVGVPVHPISALTGDGLAALSPYFAPGQTVVFLGSSGVGKSSLLNALAGKELMLTSAIREDDSKGRHTTTHRQLFMLSNGAMVIDTPGMRELGMWDVTAGIGQSFADVEEFLGRCRFSDCKHQNEPGCAVQAAIASGALSEERWEHYRKLKSEAKYSDNKLAYKRRKTEKFKAIRMNERKKKRY